MDNVKNLSAEFVRHYRNYPYHVKKYRDPFKNHLYRITARQGLAALLHYEDRNSMAHSIEARVPFLDYRLVEFIFSLPSRLIYDHGTTKIILRQALKGILPEKVRTRQSKLGFITPEKVWFSDVLKNYALSILESNSMKNRMYFPANTLETLKNNFKKYGHFPNYLWRFINLELWLRKFID